MVYLNLHLTSNDKMFEYYSLPKKILDKNYEIALVKIDGEINRSDNFNSSVDIDKNNNVIVKNKKNIDNKTSIYISCDFIDYSYVNDNNINSLYRIKSNTSAIDIEPYQLIYHKVTKDIKKINIRLIDEKNNLIKYNNIDLYIELHFKEL